jgi:predicted RNA-binding Zn ribbon-like protein
MQSAMTVRKGIVSDYNKELSELHQRVVQDEFGLSATIDDMGWILFEDSDLGEMTINLREYNQEYMNLHGVVFGDYENTRAREDLLRGCNSVNCSLNSSQELARLTLSDTYNVVHASVALVLAATGRMPDEALLRTVIVRAMSSVKAAAREFADELEKAA